MGSWKKACNHWPVCPLQWQYGLDEFKSKRGKVKIQTPQAAREAAQVAGADQKSEEAEVQVEKAVGNETHNLSFDGFYRTYKDKITAYVFKFTGDYQKSLDVVNGHPVAPACRLQEHDDFGPRNCIFEPAVETESGTAE